MNLVLDTEELAGLSDRNDIPYAPVPNQLYRDRHWPRLVFRWTERWFAPGRLDPPAGWEAFGVELMPPATKSC